MTREMQNLTTSTKCDSESDLQDQTPDTDDSGAHSYPEISTGGTFAPGTGSFKRVPIMGNRGLEQRGKKSKIKESPAVSVISCLVKTKLNIFLSRFKWQPSKSKTLERPSAGMVLSQKVLE